MDHGTLVDEQPGQVDCFGQRSAAVIAQIEHNDIDALLFELSKNSTAVAGGALEIRLTLTGAVHVHIKAGQIQYADFVRSAVRFASRLEDNSPSFAIFQFDTRAGDGINLGRRLSERDHFEANDRSFFPTNHFYYVVEFHIEDIHHGAVGSLSDADNRVTGLELSMAIGRAAGNDLAHDRVAIFQM